MEKIKVSDSELVSQFKSGNEEAFSILIDRHQSTVYTSIYYVVKDRYIAEDVLQDVFMKVVQHIRAGKYNEQGKFLPWVLRIAHNLSIDIYRKKKRFPTLSFEDGSLLEDLLVSENAEIDESVSKQESRRQLRSLIKNLPFNQKQVLIMRHFIGMSFQEIADKTGVSINTALGRMRYALVNLRKEMNKNNLAYDQNFYPK